MSVAFDFKYTSYLCIADRLLQEMEEEDEDGESGCHLMVTRDCDNCDGEVFAPCHTEPELKCRNIVEEECLRCHQTVRGQCRHVEQCRF